MTPAARLSAVIELYDEIIGTQKPSDQIMQFYFRSRKFIGSKDRKYIAETLYTILRHYARLNWWAEQTEMEHSGRNLVLLWLALGEGKDARDIEELFDGSNYGPAELNGDEKEILNHLSQQTIDTRDMPQQVRAECPDWAYEGLQRAFGEHFDDELTALQVEASLDLRVNMLKVEREAVFQRLREDNMDVVKTKLSPVGLRVEGRPAFSMHPLYQKGQIEVQDEGSQLLALLCGVTTGEWVVDFCAGAGGKTMALAAAMQNKGRIWACDIDATRLENARKRLRRADVHCVETKLLKDEKDDWVKKHANKADCVFIDAPCSGMGTWRRNPMSRWQDLGPRLGDLLQVQASILASASRMVKPGRRLVYATCSMLPQENQDQVNAFLAAHPNFKPATLGKFWAKTNLPQPLGLDLNSHMLQLTPYQHETDGFFVAAFTKDASVV
jgi:16S rRNA (cytosine967-C5)-methyltransferase